MYTEKTSKLTRIVAIVVVITSGLYLAQTALAGAGSTAWNGKGFTLGNGTCDDADQEKLQPFVDQLMNPADADNPYGPNAGLGLSESDAEARVKDVRKTVKKIIDLAKLRSDDARSEFLQDQFDAGKVCVSWGMTARGTCLIDSTTEKKPSEKILIYAKGLVGGELPIYDPLVVTLSATVIHENTHAGQSYATEGLPKNATEAQEKAALGKKYACNEVEAHGDNEAWKEAMKEALCDPDNIDPDMPLPDGLDAAVEAVLNGIRGIENDAERQQAATALKNKMESEAKADKTAKECYTEAKEAFCEFIDGDITVQQLKRRLNDAKWRHYTSWLDSPHFVHVTPPSMISQGSTEFAPAADFDTGLSRVMDFAVIRNSDGNDVLLVVGTDSRGLGELQMYSSTNGDPYFEQDSRIVLFTGEPRLQSNMAMFVNPETGRWFCYDAINRLIHTLEDSNNDLVPDQLGELPVNLPDPILADYVQFDFEVGADVPTIVATQQIDSMTPAMPAEQNVLLLQDTKGDGFFDTMVETTFDAYSVWDPVHDPATLVPGSRAVDVFARPGANLEVWLTNGFGNLLELRGSGVGQGIATATTINLSVPFGVGNQMVIVDTTNGSTSTNASLGTPAVPAASEWGLVIMALTVILVGSLLYMKQRQPWVGMAEA